MLNNYSDFLTTGLSTIDILFQRITEIKTAVFEMPYMGYMTSIRLMQHHKHYNFFEIMNYQKYEIYVQI